MNVRGAFHLHRFAALAAAAVACCLATPALAIDYTWSGGSGTWSTEAANWTWSGGSTAWPASGTANAAILAGTADTVTLSGGVDANAMSFQSSGYVIGGSGTITLNGSAPTIRVDLTSSGSATLGDASSGPVLAGSAGFTKAGAGVLTLSGTSVHTVTGGIAVSGGRLGLAFANLATPVNMLDATNSLSLSGGGSLQMNGKDNAVVSQTFAGVTVAGGLSNINVFGGAGTTGTTGTSSLTLGTVSQADTGGIVSFTAAGQALYSQYLTTNQLIVSNTADSYVGPWAFTGSPTTSAGRWAFVDGTTSQVRVQGGTGASASGFTEITSPTTVYTLNASGTFTGDRTAFGLQNTQNRTVSTGSFAFTTVGLLAINSGITLTVTGSSGGRIVVGDANQLVIAGAGNVTVNVPIVDGTAGGSHLTYTGGGTLTLGGTNTYSGVTALTAGVLQATGTGALGSGTITFGGGTLQYAADSAGSDWATRIRDSAAAVSLDTNGQSVTLAGAIDASNVGGLTKLGSGTLTLSGTNAYSGATTINAGVLQAAGTAALASGTITFGGGTLQYAADSAGTDWATRIKDSAAAVSLDTNGQSVTLAGVIDASNVGGLTKLGSGTLTLSGSNTFSGGATLSAGQLNLNNAGALGDGMFTISGGTIDNTSGGSVTLTTNPQAWNGDFAFAGTDSLNLGTGTFTLPTSTTRTVTTSSGTLTVGGRIAGTANLVKSGNGTLVLSGSSSFFGTMTVAQGTLLVSHAVALGGAGVGTTVSSGATLMLADGITTPAGESLSLNGIGVGNVGALQVQSGTATWSGPITLGSTSRVGGAADTTLRLPGAIGGTGPLVLRGADVGGLSTTVVEISGVGTYSGSTEIYAGTLRLVGGDDRLPTGGSLQMGVSLSPGLYGTLDLNGNAQTVAGLLTFGSAQAQQSNAIVNSSASADATLTVALASGTNTFAGRLLDGPRKLGLVKSGNGTLVLSGTASNYTGGTTIVAGTLALGSANGVGSGPLAVNGGALDLRGFAPTVAALSGSAAGRISSSSAGLTTLSTFQNTDSTFAGVIENGVGPVAFAKGGTGRLSLTGANTFTGTTSIDGGTLVVDGSLAGDVVVASGAMLAGSGVLGNRLSGAGLVSVGNSPGIGTAGSLDPSAGTDYVFEITGAAPAWSLPTASVNDVLRLTGATPFAANLSGANEVDILFNLAVNGPIQDGTFVGGFYADQGGDFTTVITNGAFTYWVPGQHGSAGDQREFAVGGGGALVWYSKLSAYDSSKTVNVFVVPQSVSFDGSTTVNGYSTQFVVVPEPGGFALAGFGAAAAIWCLGHRRRTDRLRRGAGSPDQAAYGSSEPRSTCSTHRASA